MARGKNGVSRICQASDRVGAGAAALRLRKPVAHETHEIHESVGVMRDGVWDAAIFRRCWVEAEPIQSNFTRSVCIQSLCPDGRTVT